MMETVINRLTHGWVKTHHGQGADDELIVSRIWDNLERFDPIRLELDTLGVDAQDGHVILTGWVNSPIQRSVIARIVARTPGVRAVENRLLVPREVEGAIFATLLREIGLQPLARAHAQVKLEHGQAWVIGDFEDWRIGERARALADETFRQILATNQPIVYQQRVQTHRRTVSAPRLVNV